MCGTIYLINERTAESRLVCNMKEHNEKVEMINTLLKEASDNFTGEFTETHQSKMNQIYYYIRELNKETGKNYVIKGTQLIEEA